MLQRPDELVGNSIKTPSPASTIISLQNAALKRHSSSGIIIINPQLQKVFLSSHMSALAQSHKPSKVLRGILLPSS